MNDPMLTRLRERHSAAVERREQIVASAQTERRDNLTEEEDREFRRLTDEIRDYKDRIAELTSQEARVTLANSAYARANGGRDQVSYVYTREGIEAVLNEPEVQLSVIWMQPERQVQARLRKFLVDNQDKFLYLKTGPPGSDEATLAMLRVVSAV